MYPQGAQHYPGGSYGPDPGPGGGGGRYARWFVVHGSIGGTWLNMGSGWESRGGDELPARIYEKTRGGPVYVHIYDPETGQWSGQHYQPPPPEAVVPAPLPPVSSAPLPVTEHVLTLADNGRQLSMTPGTVVTVQLPSGSDQGLRWADPQMDNPMVVMLTGRQEQMGVAGPIMSFQLFGQVSGSCQVSFVQSNLSAPKEAPPSQTFQVTIAVQ